MSEMRELYKTDKEFTTAVSNATNRQAEQIIHTLHQIKDVGNFEEGDILIREERKTGDTWVTEKFSKVNSAPRKYKVLYVDEVGAPYVSKISMKGDLCGDIKCVYGYDMYWYRFRHDPDFLDHQILAEEDDKFDPQEVYKEKRSEYFKTQPKRRKTQQV